MPRTLPWLAAGENGRRARDSAPQSRRTNTKAISELREETPSKGKADSSSKKDFFRSSPSPPSSPIHRCPSEEYLIEGFENDDIYMMVEDEFYSVAQTFTQHLHYAEYVRRKREAKLQHEAKIRDLARPTDGVTPISDETKKRYEAEELSTRQKAGIEGVLGKRPHEDSDREDVTEADADDNTSWAGTSLYDLMLSPRKARSLVGMQGIKSSTRAAAGYSQTPRAEENLKNDDDDNDDWVEPLSKSAQDLQGETASEDDDDLDVRTPSSSKNVQPNKHHVRPGSNRANPFSPSPSIKRSTEVRGKGRPPTSPRYETPIVRSERRIRFADFDELPELRKSRIQVQGRKSLPITKREQKNVKDNNTGSKKSRLNEVPTFML